MSVEIRLIGYSRDVDEIATKLKSIGAVFYRRYRSRQVGKVILYGRI